MNYLRILSTMMSPYYGSYCSFAYKSISLMRASHGISSLSRPFSILCAWDSLGNSTSLSFISLLSKSADFLLSPHPQSVSRLIRTSSRRVLNTSPNPQLQNATYLPFASAFYKRLVIFITIFLYIFY